jgi:hypothetical protein
MRETDQQETSPPDTLALAFYEGKESWKAEPGNRYSAEEIHLMEKAGI